MAEKSPRQLPRKPPCVEGAVIGAVIMAGALYKIWGFIDYPYYTFMFQHMPENIVQFRYCISIGLRLMLLVVGWGLIQGQEFYRKIALWISAGNILFTAFKHPYEVFYHIAVLAEARFPMPYPQLTGAETLQFPYFPWLSMMIHIMVDVGFAVLVIFYLTRPGIKAKFR